MNYFQNNPYAQPQYNAYGQVAPVNVTRVHGQEGANAYNIPPNSSVLLLDDSQPIIWFKQTDGAGYPTVVGYSISPLENTQVDISGLSNVVNNVVKRLDKLEKELGMNVESNS